MTMMMMMMTTMMMTVRGGVCAAAPAVGHGDGGASARVPDEPGRAVA
jgi:hypothetical protein